MRSTRSVSLPMPSDEEDGLRPLIRRHLGLLIGLVVYWLFDRLILRRLPATNAPDAPEFVR